MVYTPGNTNSFGALLCHRFPMWQQAKQRVVIPSLKTARRLTGHAKTERNEDCGSVQDDGKAWS